MWGPVRRLLLRRDEEAADETTVCCGSFGSFVRFLSSGMRLQMVMVLLLGIER